MNLFKTVKVLGALLFVSVVANFYMGGMILGHKYSGETRAEEWKEKDEALQAKLSEKDRAFLKKTMDKHRPAIESLRDKLEKARHNVEEAVHMDPIDQDDLEAALKSEKDSKIAIIKKVAETRNLIYGGLSSEGRAVFDRIIPPPKPNTEVWEEDPFFFEEDASAP